VECCYGAHLPVITHGAIAVSLSHTASGQWCYISSYQALIARWPVSELIGVMGLRAVL